MNKKRPLAKPRVLHKVKQAFNCSADKSVGCLPSDIFTHRTKRCSETLVKCERACRSPAGSPSVSIHA